MISRKALFGKLGLTAFRSIESATAFCKLRGNPHVELVHWLHQIFQGGDNDLHRITRHFGIESREIDRDLGVALAQLPSGATAISNFAPCIETAIERAWVIATLAFADYRVRTAHLLVAWLQTPELRLLVLDTCPAFKRIPTDALIGLLPALTAQSPEQGEPAQDGSDLAPAVPGEASGAMASVADGGSALRKYCSDLTQMAADGKIDPVIGREQEIRTITDILLRRRQNNPLLTGEAGVGKTAVVEGLALAIARGEVPPALRNVRLLGLDVGGLLAGASMKGEFESRLKAVLEEAGRSKNPVILFIDEVHTLVGAGGNAGTGDAANLLKPALARGGLRTIGATTWSEYKRHIEKDAALTRRFQVLQVPAPEEALAKAMVRGLVGAFEQHHGVLVLDEAISAAVSLSNRYIPSRQQPDKAISLLDTACARVALSLHTPPPRLQYLRREESILQAECDIQEKQLRVGRGDNDAVAALAARLEAVRTDISAVEARWRQESELVRQLVDTRTRLLDSGLEGEEARHLEMAIAALEKHLALLQGAEPLVFPEVTEAVVAAIVAEWTGIPVGRMVKDDITSVLSLSDVLGSRVVGQQHALDLIAARIRVARSGLGDPAKPIGVFLLAGPSGVGKTETALALAEAMYGGEQNLITINMSEFQEAHTVSTLKGAPPGYVGYGEGGVLTEAVRRRPYSVILLDEIEKAHRDVHEIFFQVFDKGWMEDGEGRAIDFKNTIILLTSNVGAELLTKLCNDPELTPDAETLRKSLQPELRTVFPAAFLGRLHIVPYLPLRQEGLIEIVNLQLERIRQRMAEAHAIALDIDPSVARHIVAACNVTESGARLLIGYIEQHLLPLLGHLCLDALGEQRRIARIELAMSDGVLLHQVHDAEPLPHLT